VTGSYERGNEPLGFIKCAESLSQEGLSGMEIV
jgi:hypothetical protein